MLSLNVPSHSQSYIIENVNVVPMDRNVVLTSRDVLVKNGIIESILDHKPQSRHSGYQKIDGTGQFLIPGLSDMHMHFLADDRIPNEYRKHELLVPLKYGVLNGRVPIGTPGLLEDKKRVDESDWLGPSLYIGSPQLAGVNWHPVFSGTIVKTFDEGYEAVKKYKEEGYEFIKITFGVNKETYGGIVKAGLDFNIPIAGHVPVDVKIRAAIRANQDIEHLDQYMDGILNKDTPTKTGLSAFGIFRNKSWETINFLDENKIKELIDLTVNEGIWNTPTNHFFISSFARIISEQELMAGPSYSLVSGEVREELLSMRSSYWNDPAEEHLREKYVEQRSRFIREIFRRNGKILAGSDSPEWLNLYGHALHQELFNFVDIVGLTPYEALQTATTKPAEYIEKPDAGMVKEGMRADLVLLNGDPLADIHNIAKVNGVMLRGKWLSKIELDRLYNQAKEQIRKAPLRPEYKK